MAIMIIFSGYLLTIYRLTDMSPIWHTYGIQLSLYVPIFK
jgi:hypothetical protein